MNNKEGIIKWFTLFFHIHNPTPTIIAKTMRPTMTGASTSIRNTTIVIITINTITPTIASPIAPRTNSNTD
jgi:hypothetical protein